MATRRNRVEAADFEVDTETPVGALLDKALQRINLMNLLEPFIGSIYNNETNDVWLYFGKGAKEAALRELANSLKELAPYVDMRESDVSGAAFMIVLSRTKTPTKPGEAPPDEVVEFDGEVPVEVLPAEPETPLEDDEDNNIKGDEEAKMETVMRIPCPKCRVPHDLGAFTLDARLNEEATLTCPTCGSVFALSAAMKEKSVPKPKSPPVGDVGKPGEGAGGSAAAPSAEETPSDDSLKVKGESFLGMRHQPGVLINRLSPHNVGVISCRECGMDWVGLPEECSCPVCGSNKTTRSRKRVEERIEGMINQVISGMPVENAISLIFGEKPPVVVEANSARAKKSWVGDLGEFNSKLQAVLGKLGLSTDIGDVVDELTQSKALFIRGEKIELNLDGAKKVLSKMIRGVVSAAPPPRRTPAPASQLPPEGIELDKALQLFFA